jgi:hypothetical protein
MVLQHDIDETALFESRDSIFLGTAGALSQLPCSVPHCLRTSSLPIVALVHLFADGWKLSKLWILTLRPSSLAFKPFSIESPLTVKQSCGAAFHAELSVNGAGGSASVFPLSPPEPEGTFLVTKAPLLQTYMPWRWCPVGVIFLDLRILFPVPIPTCPHYHVAVTVSYEFLYPYVAFTREICKGWNFYAEKIEHKSILERTRCRWENNVKINFKFVGW